MEPEDAFACLGASAQFGVAAEGAETLTYQWLLNGQEIPEATDSSYSVDAVGPDDLGIYRCVVTDGCGQSVSSETADLIALAVEITTHPVGAELCVGDNHFMSAQATGSPSPQWFKDGQPIDGATQFFYFILDATPEDAGVYYVVATNECESATSDNAVVEVNCGGQCPDCP